MCVSKPCALSFSGSKVNLSGRKFEHVGAWSPVMWTGNRPERNERLRAAASSPVTPRALTPHPTPPPAPLRFSPGGAAVEVGVVPHERDALLRQAAEVLCHERGVVVDLRVPPAETAAEALSAHRHGVPGGVPGGWAEWGLTRRR